MHIYLYEPRSERHQGLTRELATAGMRPVMIGPEFFRTDLSLLNRGGNDQRPFLLAAEGEATIAQIRLLRSAGCANPIIVLRDFRNSTHTAEALNAGADDDMTIPLKVIELRSRLNSVLRRAKGHASESVTVGEVTAYFDGRDPVVAGTRVRLSRREHAIFQHLALNPNRIVSKAAIYDAVYGMAEEQPLDKVIDVYICKIRKKIDAAAVSGRPYIETVYGRGYKLTAEHPDAAPLDDVRTAAVA
ncbi:two-component transcriptional regulator [Oceanicola granulosus HTCC2516]|uniref:Two-component transcriptional regulator n=1 Tax=Oceanicola granulosus (strain ATCC BAA-861 / DSM 15982 / KCTC 12143 / HTCC2516) TaxID=314256 RepID=Q2CGG8_OCEGH|nr:response regulator transcription factor [Oceanicola granulosus]EAR51750.1 two-component transcriptional regulator [Oceanicola granulosus HTCC2516]